MEFDWAKSYHEPVDGKCEDIFIPADKLDRAKYAKFLTDFLSSMDDESYVMNLNAEWGAGKTFFLQRWHHTIKKEYPSVYIDAWKHDFSDDPLLAVIAAITDYLKENTATSNSDKAQTVLNSGWRFTKKVAPELMRGITKKVSGIDISNFGDDEYSSISDLTLDKKETNGIEDFSLFAGKVFQVALADHSEKTKELELFKQAIKGWLDELIGQHDELKLPMFVFIDELDRCRPTYAIELLETVKHLFEIKGIIFVIATDTEQLQHSIKSVYGEGFDARKYLDRFFNRSFSLKQVSLSPYIESLSIYKNKIRDRFVTTLNGKVIFENGNGVLKTLTSIAMTFEFDLRSTEQWIHQLFSCYTKQNSLNESFWLWTAVLIALKKSAPSTYETIFLKNKYQSDLDFESLSKQYDFSEEISFSYIYEGLIKTTWMETDPYDREVYERYTDVSADKIRGESTFTLIKLMVLAAKELRKDIPEKLITEIAKEDINKRVFQSLLHNERVLQKTELEKYLDLVEMASDLS